MVLSNEDVAALIADFERVQRERETALRADLEMVQRERETALRADLEREYQQKAKKDLERAKWEKEAKKRENEAKLDRLRRERSVGTSFDGLGGDNSFDRRDTAASTMGPMWTRGVSTSGGLGEDSPYVPRGIVPQFPVECSPYEYIARERRFEVFIADQGLRHTISLDAPEIAVISCTNNAYLFDQFGEDLVTNYRRVWGYISEATAGATFEDRLYKCHSILDALRIMMEWSLPLHPAERHCLWRSWREFSSWGTKTSIFICPHFPSRDNDACCWHRERCIRNCSVHSPPVPGTSIEPPCSCRRSWFSGRGGRGSRSPTKG